MLSPPPPAPEYEVVAEGAGLFILIVAFILILLAFIVHPVQTASILGRMFLPLVSWIWNLISGIGTLVWAFIQGIPRMIAGAATSAGSYLYNNTIGRL